MKNLKKEMQDINVGWRFSERFCKRIRKHALKKGLSVNGMARMILTEWMDAQEKRVVKAPIE